MTLRRAFVTGGLGFIGSHVVDRLLVDGADVVVFDNLSTGRRANLAHHRDNPRLRLIVGDVLDLAALSAAISGADAVFHFQANADVRGGMLRTRVDLEQNTIATWNVLEATRQAGAHTIVFASSAVVYGEPTVFPTPEATPLVQTSLYGASKLAGEAMLQAYSECFGVRTLTFRLVSWTGPRYSHGIITDVVRKLRQNPDVLEILGDGSQRKSYLDVRDGLAGIFLALMKTGDKKAVFNLGHDEVINVLEVARIVSGELGLHEVRFRTTGGQRGWVGDSPMVHLDTTRMKALGWAPRISIQESISATVRYLIAHPESLRV